MRAPRQAPDRPGADDSPVGEVILGVGEIILPVAEVILGIAEVILGVRGLRLGLGEVLWGIGRSRLDRRRTTRPGRAVPDRSTPGRLLIATWNLANLGVQARSADDYRLLAAVIGWFHLVAVQEVAGRLDGLRAVLAALPGSWRMLVSDVGGNRERLGFLYDSDRVRPLELVGELAVPPSSARWVRLPGVEQRFRGFDRNPYLAAFQAGELRFTAVTVHLYFGSAARRALNRRSLEAYAVARWADLHRRRPWAYARHVVALGDFNLPKAEAGDPVYDAPARRGLHLPAHSSRVGSSVRTDRQYDQVAVFDRGAATLLTGRAGVFDFDGAVFAELWERRSRKEFLDFVRYHLSDHRPLWAELRTGIDG